VQDTLGSYALTLVDSLDTLALLGAPRACFWLCGSDSPHKETTPSSRGL